ncbi:hypothetical protein ACFFUB_00295 [Algimonas porphyrae]|uniref:Uncharacterized protein n=1 Tax=Algimonas porphyrae TaxID=1128113 RepID=A0ABQ5UZX1_9PROT|nr:hypothetical protein [Algimonas porphyrae]GLQ20469.1 hypothetical protein GCM10007854_14240 [Algimonas porphyrae]
MGVCTVTLPNAKAAQAWSRRTGLDVGAYAVVIEPPFDRPLDDTPLAALERARTWLDVSEGCGLSLKFEDYEMLQFEAVSAFEIRFIERALNSQKLDDLKQPSCPALSPEDYAFVLTLGFDEIGHVQWLVEEALKKKLCAADFMRRLRLSIKNRREDRLEKGLPEREEQDCATGRARAIAQLGELLKRYQGLSLETEA